MQALSSLKQRAMRNKAKRMPTAMQLLRPEGRLNSSKSRVNPAAKQVLTAAATVCDFMVMYRTVPKIKSSLVTSCHYGIACMVWLLVQWVNLTLCYLTRLKAEDRPIPKFQKPRVKRRGKIKQDAAIGSCVRGRIFGTQRNSKKGSWYQLNQHNILSTKAMAVKNDLVKCGEAKQVRANAADARGFKSHLVEHTNFISSTLTTSVRVSSRVVVVHRLTHVA